MITLTVLFGLVYIVYHGYLSLYPIGTLQSLQSLSRLSPKFGRPKEIDSTHNTSIDSRYNRIFVKRKDEKQYAICSHINCDSYHKIHCQIHTHIIYN
eukprot:UN07851